MVGGRLCDIYYYHDYRTSEQCRIPFFCLCGEFCGSHIIIIIIIEGLSLLQSIPPTTADKQTQAQKRRGSRSRKLLGAKAKSGSHIITNILRCGTT